MEDNKDKLNIQNLSDSEFLSFLFSERDRENSQRHYQCWNIWALAGALVILVCAGYQVIKGNVEPFKATQVVYLISGLLAAVFFLRPFFLLVKKERGVDDNKVKTLKDVAPYHYLFLMVVVSSLFSVFMLLFDKNNPWNVITIAWMVSFVCFSFGLCYVFICQGKIVKADNNEMVFPNEYGNRWYNASSGSLLFVTAFESFRRVENPILGSPGFELSVCISAAVLLVYFLIKVCSIEKKANKMDILIDGYLYKEFPKEMAFRILRMDRMGNTVFESCWQELMGLHKAFEGYEQRKQKMQEVLKLFEKGEVDPNKLMEYNDEMMETLDFSEKCINMVEKLGNKLKEIERQAPWLMDDKEYKGIVKVLGCHVEKEKDLVEFTSSATEMMQSWLDKFLCNKRGGLCGREDCPIRNEKAPWWFRLRLWRKKRIILLKGKCKRMRRNSRENSTPIIP